jgi:hypothetical protein
MKLTKTCQHTIAVLNEDLAGCAALQATPSTPPFGAIIEINFDKRRPRSLDGDTCFQNLQGSLSIRLSS